MSLLKSLEFCHHLRIANCDVSPGNLLVDIVAPNNFMTLSEDDTYRFSLMDFGYASMLPLDSPLTDAEPRSNIYRLEAGGTIPRNPFVVDVMMLGEYVQEILSVGTPAMRYVS